MTNSSPSQERTDLLESLTAHRAFLRQTAAGLTDDEARLCSTVSDLSIGGIIKHVAATEKSWADFMVSGSAQNDDPDMDWSDPDPAVAEAHRAGFRLLDSETLDGVLEEYGHIARRTDQLVRELDLDQSHPLPPFPWFTPGASRSVRRVVVHIVAETAQHAGHADIIRESIDGAKTMA